MSVLCVDVGNSRLKWGLLQAGDWVAQGVVDRQALPIMSADALPWQHGFRDLDTALVVSVAGPEVAELLRPLLPAKTRWVQAEAEAFGVRNGYAAPEHLGADRFVALVAVQALRETPTPALVVMAGTALTIDVLLADGVFSGGIIVPGQQLMRSALGQGTHALAALENANTVLGAFPKNSAAALAGGRWAASVGAIAVQLAHAVELTGAEVELWLSGGDASALRVAIEQVPPLFAGRLSGPLRCVDNLVLEGLRVMALTPMRPTNECEGKNRGR